jgi:AcrR family transcriptional regulator
MSDVKSSRRAKADATRHKILRAAHAEFCDRGYHGATIASIAKRAGVATQTVYFVFHTKAELISATIDTLVMGEEQPTIPQEAPWWLAMRAEPDPVEALHEFVRGAAPLFQRASALGEILRAAALTDDEVRRTHDHHEELRATGFREVVEVLAAKAPLRHGLTVDTATDVLLVALSDSVYVQLTTERGWSHDDVVRWFCDALPSLLLAGQPSPPPRG